MTKRKSKQMTMERLAAMAQREFAAVRKETGEMRLELKEDINVLREDVNVLREDVNVLREDVNVLRRDTEAGFAGVSHGMQEIMEKLNQIQADVVEIHDLRGRVERLEKKVGLRR
jgi:polyhydroxyalkanoate synthesis regulator phasin